MPRRSSLSLVSMFVALAVLSGCSGEDERGFVPEEYFGHTESWIINGQLDTTHQAVVATFTQNSGCTGTINAGPDAMTQVELGPGETIVVNVGMPGSNPAIYLLYNCTSATSCAAGSDLDVGPDEGPLQYTNNGGATEILYLVVDTKTAMNPYFMTIAIF